MGPLMPPKASSKSHWSLRSQAEAKSWKIVPPRRQTAIHIVKRAQTHYWRVLTMPKTSPHAATVALAQPGRQRYGTHSKRTLHDAKGLLIPLQKGSRISSISEVRGTGSCALLLCAPLVTAVCSCYLLAVRVRLSCALSVFFKFNDLRLYKCYPELKARPWFICHWELSTAVCAGVNRGDYRLSKSWASVQSK